MGIAEAENLWQGNLRHMHNKKLSPVAKWIDSQGHRKNVSKIRHLLTDPV